MYLIRSVLIASDFGKPWNPGFYIKKGLERNNIGVTIFDPGKANDSHQGLLEAVRAGRPDILLFIKDYGLRAEWLSEVKMMGVPVVQWYIDPVIPEWLPPFVKAADIFFTMSEGLVETFRRLNSQSFWLTQAFEPSIFEVDDITPSDIGFYGSDVAFVGNLGSKAQYLGRRDMLQKVLDAGIGLKWWGPPIPRKFSTIPLIAGKIGRSYGGEFIWGASYAKVARLSKIFLAVDSMPQIRKSMSARMYTAVGCGAFYLCRHVEGIEDVLLPDREIVTFHSDEEMMSKIRYYLSHEAARRRIAEAGRTRVLKDHTYQVRMRQMCDLLGKELHHHERGEEP